MSKRFLSEVIDGAQSVETKKWRKEINVCDFGSGSGISAEQSSKGAAGGVLKARDCRGFTGI